ncbi:MAG: GNAT family N-acetyltransferase [Proteobacteria bacterium]|nr:GNAT family N-acetyltransferase [Pseudomonadota bacterium]
MLEEFPIFLFEDFILRELSSSDVLRYFQVMNDPGVAKYLGDEDIPDSLLSAKLMIQKWKDKFYNKSSIYWAIADTQDNFIGSIGFNFIQENYAEISYDLSSSFWRRSIAYRAAKKIMIFASSKMHIKSIGAKSVPSNLASINLLKKLGFEYIKTIKDYRVIHRKIGDAAFYMKEV